MSVIIAIFKWLLFSVLWVIAAIFIVVFVCSAILILSKYLLKVKFDVSEEGKFKVDFKITYLFSLLKFEYKYVPDIKKYWKFKFLFFKKEKFYYDFGEPARFADGGEKDLSSLINVPESLKEVVWFIRKNRKLTYKVFKNFWNTLKGLIKSLNLSGNTKLWFNVYNPLYTGYVTGILYFVEPYFKFVPVELQIFPVYDRKIFKTDVDLSIKSRFVYQGIKILKFLLSPFAWMFAYKFFRLYKEKLKTGN